MGDAQEQVDTAIDAEKAPSQIAPDTPTDRDDGRVVDEDGNDLHTADGLVAMQQSSTRDTG